MNYTDLNFFLSFYFYKSGRCSPISKLLLFKFNTDKFYLDTCTTYLILSFPADCFVMWLNSAQWDAKSNNVSLFWCTAWKWKCEHYPDFPSSQCQGREIATLVAEIETIYDNSTLVLPLVTNYLWTVLGEINTFFTLLKSLYFLVVFVCVVCVCTRVCAAYAVL